MATNMTDLERTVTVMYDSRDAAEAARDQLTKLGISSDEVMIEGTGNGSTGTAGGTEGRGFWANLFAPDEDRHAYREGVDRGGYVLSASVPAGKEDEAIAVLEQSGAVDMNERTASWRQSGWQGYEGGTAATAAAPVATGAAPVAVAMDDVQMESRRADLAANDANPTRTREGDAPLQVVEEELRVGKREVGRGSVRVRSYVRERPVEEQVELRQEHVTIERRPVNRELRPGDPAFEERTIEAVERGEEAVVSKTARVVEEIAVRTDVDTELETVRDTVRKQDVEVEDDRAGRGVGTTDAVTEADGAVDTRTGTTRERTGP